MNCDQEITGAFDKHGNQIKMEQRHGQYSSRTTMGRGKGMETKSGKSLVQEGNKHPGSVGKFHEEDGPEHKTGVGEGHTPIARGGG